MELVEVYIEYCAIIDRLNWDLKLINFSDGHDGKISKFIDELDMTFYLEADLSTRANSKKASIIL